MNAKLLDHLIKSGAVDARHVRAAIAQHRQSGDDVLKLLRYRNAISDVDLARALGAFFKCKVVDINRVKPKRDALQIATADFCLRHEVLPFSIDRQTGELLVAVSNPERAEAALDTLQRDANRRIRTYIAPLQGLLKSIRQAYPSAAKSGGQSLEELTDTHNKSASWTMNRSQIVEVSTIARVPDFQTASPTGVGIRRGSSPGISSMTLEELSDLVPVNGVVEHLRTEFGKLQKENEALREHVHRLERSLQLEIELVRQLAELLLEQGVLNRQQYLEKMSRLR